MHVNAGLWGGAGFIEDRLRICSRTESRSCCISYAAGSRERRRSCIERFQRLFAFCAFDHIALTWLLLLFIHNIISPNWTYMSFQVCKVWPMRKTNKRTGFAPYIRLPYKLATKLELPINGTNIYWRSLGVLNSSRLRTWKIESLNSTCTIYWESGISGRKDYWWNCGRVNKRVNSYRRASR